MIHHAVNPAVEKHFELPGHVAPIAWRTDYKSVAFLHLAQNPFRIVLRHHAIVSATAFHATDTRAKFQLADINDCYLGAFFKQGITHEYAGSRYPLEEKNPELARKYPNSIKFDEDANPIFDPYTKTSVRFENPATVCGKNKKCFIEGVKNKCFLEGNSGSGSSDFKAANARMGYPGQDPPSICGPKANEACTWHHKEDGSLQLVPRDLHKAIGHEGGASLIRQQIEQLYF